MAYSGPTYGNSRVPAADAILANVQTCPLAFRLPNTKYANNRPFLSRALRRKKRPNQKARGFLYLTQLPARTARTAFAPGST
jgi:hypothetical protein